MNSTKFGEESAHVLYCVKHPCNILSLMFINIVAAWSDKTVFCCAVIIKAAKVVSLFALVPRARYFSQSPRNHKGPLAHATLKHFSRAHLVVATRTDNTIFCCAITIDDVKPISPFSPPLQKQHKTWVLVYLLFTTVVTGDARACTRTHTPNIKKNVDMWSIELPALLSCNIRYILTCCPETQFSVQSNCWMPLILYLWESSPANMILLQHDKELSKPNALTVNRYVPHIQFIFWTPRPQLSSVYHSSLLCCPRRCCVSLFRLWMSYRIGMEISSMTAPV